jgi:hypothetical protein
MSDGEQLQFHTKAKVDILKNFLLIVILTYPHGVSDIFAA